MTSSEESMVDSLDLSDRDIRLIFKIKSLQNKGVRVRIADLAEFFHVSRPTIERSLKKFRELEILNMSREGSVFWRYEFHDGSQKMAHHAPSKRAGEVSEMTHHSFAKEESSQPKNRRKIRLPLSIHTKRQLSLARQNKNRRRPINLLDLSKERSSLGCFRSLEKHKTQENKLRCRIDKPLISPESNIIYLFPLDTEMIPKEEVMPKVSGPSGPIRDAVEQGLSQSKEAHCLAKKRTSKAPKQTEVFKVKRTRAEQQRAAMEQKDVSEYNCNDMWYVFKDFWRWEGKPIGWTKRDRKHIKELIDEQGAEAVVTYIKYAIEHWNALCSRFNVSGKPSVPCLYGYRRTWLYEALEGGPKARKNYGAEYSDSDIPSGSWG